MKGISILKLTTVQPSTMNPRKSFNEEALQELATSICKQGVLQPIIVRENGRQYEIIAGERRYRASIIAGLTEIPAIVRELSDDEALDIMITENLQRKDVSPIEEAGAFLQLITLRHLSITDLSARFGKSEFYIRNRLRLNELIPEFLQLIEEDKIPTGHATEICKLEKRVQLDLYQSHYSDQVNCCNWRYYATKKIKQQLNELSLPLDKASFCTQPCKACNYNSAYNNLFPGEEKCTNRFCYEQKVRDHTVEAARKIKNLNPEALFVVLDCMQDVPTVEQCRNSGINVLSSSLFEVRIAPDRPVRYMNEADENYEKRMIDYSKRMEEYDHLKQSGYVPATFVKKSGLSDNGVVRHKQSELEFTEQGSFSALKDKIKREEELALINTFEDCKAVFATYKVPEESKMTPYQENLFCYLMLKHMDTTDREKLLPNLDFDTLDESGTLLPVIAKIPASKRFQVFMYFAKEQLANYYLKNQLWRSAEAEVFIQLTATLYPDKVNEIIRIRTEKKNKRIDKLNQQIQHPI